MWVGPAFIMTWNDMHACNDLPIHAWMEEVRHGDVGYGCNDGRPFSFVCMVLNCFSVVKLQLVFFWMYWHMEYIELNNACMYMIQHISSKPDREHAFMHSCTYLLRACIHVHTPCPSRSVGPWCAWCSTAIFRRQGSSMHACFTV